MLAPASKLGTRLNLILTPAGEALKAIEEAEEEKKKKWKAKKVPHPPRDGPRKRMSQEEAAKLSRKQSVSDEHSLCLGHGALIPYIGRLLLLLLLLPLLLLSLPSPILRELARRLLGRAHPPHVHAVALLRIASSYF